MPVLNEEDKLMFTLQIEADFFPATEKIVMNKLSKALSNTKSSHMVDIRGGRDSARNSSSLTYNNSTVKSSKRGGFTGSDLIVC